MNKEDRQYVLESSAKALLALIPGIGGTIQSILSDALADRKEERLREAFDSLKNDLNEHKIEINKSFISTIDFIDLFEITATKIRDERIKEKRVAYKNILLHGILSADINYDELEEQISILDQLYANHILLLSFFNNPETFINNQLGFKVGGYMANSYRSFFKNYFPQFEKEHLEDLLFQLENLRLVVTMSSDLQTMMMSVSISSFNDKLTKRGRKFVEYIII